LKTTQRGVEAVLYLDARRRDFFTNNRQTIVEHGLSGIALFVGRRYN